MPRSFSIRRVLAAALASLAGLLAAASASAAYTWSSPVTVIGCCDLGGPWYANADDSGDALIVLGDGRIVEQLAAGAWTVLMRAGTPGRAVTWMDAEMAPSGAAAAVWVENRRTAYQRVRAVVRDSNARFGAALRVTPDMGEGARRTQVAIDDAGNALAVWEAGARRSYDRGHIEAAYRPAGGTFGRPWIVSEQGATFPSVDLARDADGVIAWARGTRVEAAAVRRGTLGAVRLIGTTGSPSGGPNAFQPGSPSLAVAPDGDAVIAWAAVLPKGAGGGVEDGDTRPRVVRASRRPRGRLFGAPSVLRTLRLRDGSLGPITAAAGPSGRALVVWQELRYDVNDARGLGLNGIFSRLRGAFARGRDRFGAHVAVTPDQQGYVTDPAVAFGPGGDLAVAWSWYLDANRSGLQVAADRHDAIGFTRTVSSPVPLDWGVQSMSPRISIDAYGRVSAFWRQQQLLSTADGGHYGDVYQTAMAVPG